MTETTLEKWGFSSEINILRCRLCDMRINKKGSCVLYKNNPKLRVTVFYGWCRKYTHGISISRVMK